MADQVVWDFVYLDIADRSYFGDKDRYLRDGWEPFAVTQHVGKYDIRHERIYLRKSSAHPATGG